MFSLDGGKQCILIGYRSVHGKPWVPASGYQLPCFMSDVKSNTGSSMSSNQKEMQDILNEEYRDVARLRDFENLSIFMSADLSVS